jgi:hypothetical protein
MKEHATYALALVKEDALTLVHDFLYLPPVLICTSAWLLADGR